MVDGSTETEEECEPVPLLQAYSSYRELLFHCSFEEHRKADPDMPSEHLPATEEFGRQVESSELGAAILFAFMTMLHQSLKHKS